MLKRLWTKLQSAHRVLPHCRHFETRRVFCESGGCSPTIINNTINCKIEAILHLAAKETNWCFVTFTAQIIPGALNACRKTPQNSFHRVENTSIKINRLLVIWLIRTMTGVVVIFIHSVCWEQLNTFNLNQNWMV